MRRIIWWIRRDIRLGDNATLFAALQDASAVIPAFVVDPRLFDSPSVSNFRRQFLVESLNELDAGLRKLDGYLVVRRGRPEVELLRLAQDTQADAVYHHRDYTPFAERRDAAVKAALCANHIEVRTFAGNYLAEPDAILKDDGTPYVVFTPYRRRFERNVTIPARRVIRRNLGTPPGIHSDSLPQFDLTRVTVEAGERAARCALRTFAASGQLERYDTQRNDLAADATSHLSPHLHFGTLSAADAYRAACDVSEGGAEGPRTWGNELIWRDFYAQLLWHFPRAQYADFRPARTPQMWRINPDWFAAWADGRTGYPIVDAAMRQLNATGWLPNRARMIVASFLVKDLLQDWRLGERYFRSKLIDADVASNSGGWQWTAGTGADAQPFVRIFNPRIQARRFDASGEYVRRWLPELRRFPAEVIHEPWCVPAAEQQKYDCAIGRDYPAPIVDHAVRRELALRVYHSNFQS